MEINVSMLEELVVVEPKGRLDSLTSAELGQRLRILADAGTANIVVDLGNTVYISSAGFRILLIAAKEAAERDASFALCSLNNELHRLFEMGAFLDLFRIYPTREQSIAEIA